MTDIVQIITSDKTELSLPLSVAIQSSTLKNILESPFREHDSHIIELTQFNTPVMRKVIEYLEYKNQYANSEDDDIPEFNVPPELSLELLLAADYLNI